MEPFIVIAVLAVVLYLVFRIFKTLLKWLFIAVVVALVVAFFSNPDFDDHRDQLTNVNKKLRKDIRAKKITFDNYKIFSVTKSKVNGEEKIVGIGVFGKVWNFGDEE